MNAKFAKRLDQAQDFLIQMAAPKLTREKPLRPPLKAPLADRLSAKSLGILLHVRQEVANA